ncbi:unnamed protein product, partial [Rhizoctonia solani]
MPPTHQRLSHRHNLRNGALLAVSEAAKLINIPLAHDVARHIQQIAVALKPSVLQAPRTNDSSAQKLEKHVQGLLNTLNIATHHLNHSGVGAHGDMFIELCELQTQLSETYVQLQDIQIFQYTTKLASQTEIRDRILGLKEELSQTIVDLTLRLLVTVLNSSAHHQLAVVHQLDATTRNHDALVREHNALVRQHTSISRKHASLARKHGALRRATQHRQRTSDTRIRRLE